MTRLFFINPLKTLNASHSFASADLSCSDYNRVQSILDTSYALANILKKNQNLVFSQKSKSQKNCFLCWNKTKVRSSQSGGNFEILTETVSWEVKQKRSKFLHSISLFLICKIFYFKFIFTPFCGKLMWLINDNIMQHCFFCC